MTGLQHAGDLRLGLGQRHGQRALAVGGQAVAFIGARLLVLPEQRVRGQLGPQGLDQLRATPGAEAGQRGGLVAGRLVGGWEDGGHGVEL